MLKAPSNLPSDVASLQAMIALRDAEIETRDRKLSIFAAEIQERDYRIEKLKHELAGLRRHRFGSRSEALDQLELTLEEEEIARAAVMPPVEDDKANQTNDEKRKPRRKPHYTTAVAEDGKSWFSDGFFLGKGMILCSEKHVPPSVKNYVRLSR